MSQVVITLLGMPALVTGESFYLTLCGTIFLYEWMKSLVFPSVHLHCTKSAVREWERVRGTLKTKLIVPVFNTKTHCADLFQE